MRTLTTRLFLPFFLVFLWVQSAFPQDVAFERPDLGLALRYPPSMTPAGSPAPEVLLLLRGEDQGFPTFNLLIQPGNPKVLEKDVPALRADVVDSYRAVGLFDAEARLAEKREVANRTVFFARIHYEQKGVPTVAGVYIIPGANRYYVATLVHNEARFSRYEPILEGIVQSMTLKEPAPKGLPADDGTRGLMWTGGILAVLISALLVSRLKRRSNSRR